MRIFFAPDFSFAFSTDFKIRSCKNDSIHLAKYTYIVSRRIIEWQTNKSWNNSSHLSYIFVFLHDLFDPSKSKTRSFFRHVDKLTCWWCRLHVEN